MACTALTVYSQNGIALIKTFLTYLRTQWGFLVLKSQSGEPLNLVTESEDHGSGSLPNLVIYREPLFTDTGVLKCMEKINKVLCDSEVGPIVSTHICVFRT